jgi:hypothetical protein
MITYLLTEPFRDTVETYLATWGREVREIVEVLSYDELFNGRVVEAATVVFCDLERLTPDETSLADEAWLELSESSSPPLLLNRPSSALSRTALIQTLHAREVNSYTALPLRNALGRLRYPVFVRHRSEHWGPLTPLLPDRHALELAVTRAYLLRRIDELLAVEFCDTADSDGMYRKYAAFVIGDRILPRHLVFDHAWQLKTPRLLDGNKLTEERAYLEANPHREELLSVARIAGVDYGRFDYGLLNGKVQVWEINTNPIIMMAPAAYDSVHFPNQEWFATHIAAELRRLDGPSAQAYSWSRPTPTSRVGRQRRKTASRVAQMTRTATARRVLDAGARFARPWVVARLSRAQ